MVSVKYNAYISMDLWSWKWRTGKLEFSNEPVQLIIQADQQYLNLHSGTIVGIYKLPKLKRYHGMNTYI